jgi:hypothetical protein
LKVLAAAGDAGGARALLPVIHRLAESVDVECRAYGPAAEIWRTAGLRVASIEPVNVDGYDRVLLGTSARPAGWELEYVSEAARSRVRAVSIVDSWGLHRERFTTPAGDLVLPEAIAVWDEDMRRTLVAQGFPEHRLVVTGQPVLDELALPISADQRSEIRRVVRDRLGIGDKLTVLFVSQPISMLGLASEHGFDERSVLRDLVDDLAAISALRKANVALLVKPHPRELPRGYRVPPTSSPELDIIVIERSDIAPREIVLCSDLVVGMNSILLLEACLLHIPVVSYQPGGEVVDPLPTNRWGWSRAIYAREELAAALTDELFDAQARERRARILDSAHIDGGATDRVVRLLMAE